jgi:hypothetical protein
MATEEFVDATVFLGMHGQDDVVRADCASFFAERADRRVSMSLEQVGRCDEIVWGFSRELQDAYYPFMDRLHTDMDVARLGYRRQDLVAALESRELAGLSTAGRLTMGMVLTHGGTLRTLSPELLARPGLPVLAPPATGGVRVPFRAELEKLYRVSLALRVTLGDLEEKPCTEA